MSDTVAAPGIVLLPLACTSCGATLAAEGDDVVFYCTACRNGFRLAEAASGPLVPVEVAFIAAPAVPAQRWLPFWHLPARLRLHEREGGAQGLGGMLRQAFGGGGTVETPTPSDGAFVVPAFRLPLAAATALALRYSGVLPALGERLGERLVGGCYGPEDARKIAHYAVFATEVARADTLRSLRFDLDFGEPRLLGVPFVPAGAGWADALFGIAV